MITILRKHHQWLMIVIAILAIPFIFYFQKTDFGAVRMNDLGRIYDRPVTLVEFSRNARLMNLSRALGLSIGTDLITTNVTNENDAYAEFTWNRLTVRHEAEQLGIQPNADDIKEHVKSLPRFRSDGHFDLSKYTEFTETVLPSVAFNEAQIEEIVSDQLTLNRLRDLIGVGTQIPESESKENYEKAYGKLHVAVVRLSDADFQKDINISDDDITKYYEAHKDQLKSDEKRKVEFVSFTLTDAEKKLKGKERVDPLQKLADRANDFTQALLVKDAKFTEVAAKFEVPVIETGEFTSSAPPPAFPAGSQLAQHAFQLTQQDPRSDAIQASDGFYVLNLLGITEAHPLSQEEAKPKIVETLTAERLRQLVSNKGAEIAQQLRDAIKTKSSLDAAISKSRVKPSAWWPPELTAKLGLARLMEPNNLKLERVPVFSFIESSSEKEEAQLEPKYETADLQSIKGTVSTLEPGDVSQFTPVKDGGFVAVLEKREKADPAGYADAKTKFETSNLAQRRRAVFTEWMRDRRKAAKVILPTS